VVDSNGGETRGAVIEIISWVDFRDFKESGARVAAGESGDVTELRGGETERIGSGDAGGVGGADGIHVEAPKNMAGGTCAEDGFEGGENAALAQIGHRNGVCAFFIKIVQMRGSDSEGLIGNFVEIGRNEERFFKEHAVRSAAVAGGAFAHVEMGIDIEGEEVHGTGVGGEGTAIGIGDVVTAAEDDELFAIGEDLLNYFGVEAMGCFESVLNDGIAEVKKAGFGGSNEAIKTGADGGGGGGCTNTAAIAADAFILRAAEENDF
jgi:hypothetical protein